jgi:hypothetical protein
VTVDKRFAIALKSRAARRLALAIGALAIVGAVAASGYLMGSGPAGPTVLSPAPGPPAVGLCSQQLSIGPGGDASPLFCSNGSINRLAWEYFANAHLSVIGLGIFASDTDVASAIAQDMRGGSTGPMECSAYRLAAAYYGWSFGVDATSGALKGGCPIERP